MLKAKLIKSNLGPSYNRWQINFHEPNKPKWGGNFVGNAYPSYELQQAGYSGSYEFYYYDHTTSEIINMYFLKQQELMKFLTHIGNELRAKAARRT